MEQWINNIGSAFGVIASLLIYIFRMQQNQQKEKITELERKIEKLDTEVRIIENEKYNEIMLVLGEIKTEIAVIKAKMGADNK